MSNAPTLPIVRVVVPCRNEVAFIGACIDSIVKAERTGMDLELWICDGMSDDGTREIISTAARTHAWIKLVDNPARTTPQAMNIGLRPEGYAVGIILGAHAEVAVDFFRKNLDALRDHPEAGCVGGIIENVSLDDTSRRIGAAMGHPFGVGSAHFRTGLKEGDVDTVAFGAYRREVFEKIGYFDERLVRNQDDEFNYRVIKSGWRIWLSSAIRSRYYVRGSYAKLFRQYRQYGYWKVFVNRLHLTITTFRQLVPAIFVIGTVTGLVIACIWPMLFPVWLIGIGSYGLIAMVSALRAAPKRTDVNGVMLSFLILHAAYGIGYVQGLLDLVILGRGPKASASDLTR